MIKKRSISQVETGPPDYYIILMLYANASGNPCILLTVQQS